MKYGMGTQSSSGMAAMTFCKRGDVFAVIDQRTFARSQAPVTKWL
jgi:hypothetical protein